MWIMLTILAALVVAGVAASVVVVRRDGYRAAPTLLTDTAYDNEGDRNRYDRRRRFATR
jgi:hypothetical protein